MTNLEQLTEDQLSIDSPYLRSIVATVQEIGSRTTENRAETFRQLEP